MITLQENKRYRFLTMNSKYERRDFDAVFCKSEIVISEAPPRGRFGPLHRHRQDIKMFVTVRDCETNGTIQFDIENMYDAILLGE